MTIQRVQPAGLHVLPLFTHVVKAGNTVYVAGQTAFDANGQIVRAGDVEAQTTQAFENLAIALGAVGGTLEHLVKLTIFATDPAYLRPIAEVRRRYLGFPDPVASTFVAVTALALPDLLVEIDAIAVLS